MRAKRKLSKTMVAYFQSYDGQEGVPSFEKFAETLGLDAERIAEWAEKDPTFGRAYRRCLTILRDRLIDAALQKRYDPSFCKYLLDSMNDAAVSGGASAPFEVEVKIV